MPGARIQHAIEGQMLFLLESGFSGKQCRLYVNNTLISQSTPLSDLVEATFPGYGPVSLGAAIGPTWFPDFGVTGLEWPPVSWTVGSFFGTQYVQGYYVTDGSGALLWVEKFGEQQQIYTTGQVLTVTPKLQIAPINLG